MNKTPISILAPGLFMEAVGESNRMTLKFRKP